MSYVEPLRPLSLKRVIQLLNYFEIWLQIHTVLENQNDSDDIDFELSATN